MTIVETSGPSVAGPPLTAARCKGLELLGEFQGSGSQQPPCLVRRPDGQVLQLSPLVYRVLEAVDGQRSAAEVAAVATLTTGRELDAEGVTFLLEKKLTPLGLIDVGEGAPAAPRADPLLALQGRTPLLSAGASNAAAVALQPLFRPYVILASVLALALFDAWLLVGHQLSDSVRQVVETPSIALLIFGMSLVATLFHELGHAAACRYGGARPGVIGVGLYLFTPAFFTDVTDSYRLGRSGRVRTDLGGLYFHALSVLAIAGLYAATGIEWLLLVVIVIQLEMLEQLLPLVRYDGYYVLADLVGVPDLFARIGPVLRTAVHRSGPRDPRVVGLKLWVRVTVTTWVAVVVPVLAVSISLLVWHLPRLVTTLVTSSAHLGGGALTAFSDGQIASGLVLGINMVLLCLVAAGIVYLLQGIARRLAAAAWTWSAGHQRRRATVVLTGLGLAVSLVLGWVMSGQLTNW